MRPADCVALMKILLLSGGFVGLCHVGDLHIARSHLGLLRTRLWAACGCDPGVAQLCYVV